MDSEVDVLKKLIEEGKSYTFENFSVKLQKNNYRLYAGEETRNWTIYKKRVKNIIEKYSKENTPAIDIVKNCLSKELTGCASSDFNKVKSDLVTALNLLHENIENDIYGELIESKSASMNPIFSNKVLVVHGNDEAFKVDVERFLKEIALEPLTIDGGISGTDTIVDKFKVHEDIGFVFVLLSDDEVTYSADQIETKDDYRKKELRAKQSVIFEYGFAVSHLGQNRVCCIYKGDVKVPSDISWMQYRHIVTTVDEQAYPIIKELKHAGYKISV